MHFPVRSSLALALTLIGLLPHLAAQPQMEDLGRGVVAIHQPDGKVAVSWRLLGTDPEGVAFNLYRDSERLPGGRGGFGRGTPAGPVRLNFSPLTGPTFFVDETANLASKTSYFVRAVVDGTEREPSARFTFPAGAPPLPYLAIRLQPPPESMPGDASAGDLDGDGEYELVVKFEQHPRDNSQGGLTGETRLQAYKLDGTLLWTINLGKNIREGAHYTQFMVYDLDGDGRAEVAMKTADGTIDGRGKVIGDPRADWREPEGATVQVFNRRTNRMEARPSTGHILRGPEYFTIFDGLTGAELATVPYVPARHPAKPNPTAAEVAEIWGDGLGNRADRYLACIAYLDGVRPSVVMCRGYYTRAVLAAWDWRDGRLMQRWVFDTESSEANHAYRGQGNHNLSVADVDGDGRQEIIYGACVIDDDGRGLHSTGWGHGDAMHVTDHVPDRPGLEVFNIQERFDRQGANLRDARTGEPIWLKPSLTTTGTGGDAGEGPGRAAAFNIDPRHPGSEVWVAGNGGINGLYNSRGEQISTRRPRAVNFAVWWDDDLLRELLDRNVITKWDWESETERTLLIAQDQSANNGTKATPTLSADLLGDWREEVIWRTTNGKELRIYTTTIPTRHRLTALMHDPQYRVAVAWQNVAYNQPPHPGFHLDEAAPLPPRPKITIVRPRR